MYLPNVEVGIAAEVSIYLKFNFNFFTYHEMKSISCVRYL